MHYAETGGRFTGCWDPRSSQFLHACVCSCENKRWRDEDIDVGECFVVLCLCSIIHRSVCTSREITRFCFDQLSVTCCIVDSSCKCNDAKFVSNTHNFVCVDSHSSRSSLSEVKSLCATGLGSFPDCFYSSELAGARG